MHNTVNINSSLSLQQQGKDQGELALLEAKLKQAEDVRRQTREWAIKEIQKQNDTIELWKKIIISDSEVIKLYEMFINQSQNSIQEIWNAKLIKAETFNVSNLSIVMRIVLFLKKYLGIIPEIISRLRKIRTLKVKIKRDQKIIKKRQNNIQVNLALNLAREEDLSIREAEFSKIKMAHSREIWAIQSEIKAFNRNLNNKVAKFPVENINYQSPKNINATNILNGGCAIL